MKTGKYLSVVLAALLLAGCAGADSSGSTDTSSESDASQAQQAEESKASEDSSKTDEPAQNTDDKSGGRPMPKWHSLPRAVFTRTSLS